MMKRGLLTYILLLCCIAGASAQTDKTDMPKWTFGTEVSYAATFFAHEYHYFISPDGYRDIIQVNKAMYDTDSEVNLHVGYNLNENWNLSLYLGYTDVGDFHKAVPVSLRATRYFGDNPLNDRWFAFADIGSGISLKDKPQPITCGKIGGGYRLSLSRYSKLDFLMALRAVYTHPEISYNGVKIFPTDISRNDGMVLSLSLGVGLTF